MNYLVIVTDDGIIIEKMVFSYRDEALYYLECRRKQGYFVTLKSVVLLEKEKK